MIEEGIMAEQYARDVDGKNLEDGGDRSVKAPHGDGEGDGDGWGRLEDCDGRYEPLLNLAGKDGLRAGLPSAGGLISELVWWREDAKGKIECCFDVKLVDTAVIPLRLPLLAMMKPLTLGRTS